MLFPVASLKLSAVFAPPASAVAGPSPVLSLDFHREGRLLVSMDLNSRILQVDALKGEVVKRFEGGASHKPLGLCRYTHHPQAVLCSTRAAGGKDGGSLSPGDPTAHDLRYLSLYDFSYARLFPGHTDEVVSLSMCPCDDGFASGARDRTVRLWNLKSAKALAVLNLPTEASPPQVSFDPTGKVLAVTYLDQTAQANVIKM